MLPLKDQKAETKPNEQQQQKSPVNALVWNAGKYHHQKKFPISGAYKVDKD